jgi:hypothetical protein
MPPKSVALIGAASLTTGWLLASLLAPPVAKVQTLPDRRAAARQATPVDESPTAFSEQLHLRLQHAPTAPTPRRNPFAFGARSRERTASPAAARTVEAPIADAPTVTGPVRPRFSLSGIAIANSTDGGEVRTGILSDGQTVHLVKSGDSIGGYTVVDVSESTVTLSDASGARFVLNLRN